MVCDSRHTCVPGPTTCTTNNDCAAGCYCNNGTCNETGVCKMDSDCTHLGANYTCVNNTCVPEHRAARPASSTRTAPAGQTCVNGTCQNPTNPSGCTDNAECGQGGLCVNGQCQDSCTDASTLRHRPGLLGRPLRQRPERRHGVHGQHRLRRATRPASTASATPTARRRPTARRMTSASPASASPTRAARRSATPTPTAAPAPSASTPSAAAHCFNSDDCLMCGAGGLTCTMGYCQ